MENYYHKQQKGSSSETSNRFFDISENNDHSLGRNFISKPPKSQSLTFGEILLFVLQLIALVLLFMYIYNTPTGISDKEIKGVVVSKDS